MVVFVKVPKGALRLFGVAYLGFVFDSWIVVGVGWWLRVLRLLVNIGFVSWVYFILLISG